MNRRPLCAYCGEPITNRFRKGDQRITIENRYEGIPGKPRVGWHSVADLMGGCWHMDPVVGALHEMRNANQRRMDKGLAARDNTRTTDLLLRTIAARGPGRVVAANVWFSGAERVAKILAAGRGR